MTVAPDELEAWIASLEGRHCGGLELRRADAPGALVGLRAVA
ncbi:MAG: hypothetical protein V3T05_08385 [Myxococcota bacterium]